MPRPRLHAPDLPMPPAVLARLEAEFDVVRGEGVPEGVEGLLITPRDKMTEAALAALPASVKIIATFSVGYDHIDVPAAHRRGLIVTNTPDVLTDATADIALLLLLAASRRAREGEAMVREGTWAGWNPMQLIGWQITGKRLGIVGMGRIGQALAQRARACGMQIHYYNRTRLTAEEEAGAVYHASLDSLLAVSEFLSLHAPATPETDKLLSAERIAKLPIGAIVVNTARGNLVDDDALIAALQSGHLAAAGLDVFTGEPNLDARYRTLPNVFPLPHLGSATVETRTAMGMRALDNLAAVLNGRPPLHPIPV
jgi:lactate dehydrogenase-like 2-hydroxyacid dehydrogenase